MMLDFMLPTEKNKEDVLAFYKEFEADNSVCIGMHNYEDYDVWLTGMRNRHTGKNLPQGYVQEDFYLCYLAEELVGVFSLKMTLTDYLLNYGGHIGYAVRPSKQNQGIATKMLEKGLEIARNHGFKLILCVCDEGNEASEKVIRKNGGVFENALYDSEEDVMVKRFWIS